MGVLDNIATAWRNLGAAQRRVAIAALLLLATMFLPWYSKTSVASSSSLLGSGSISKTESKVKAITTFTFVEAAIFLVAVGVLYLMYARGRRRGFHLPFGDGNIVTAAGGWATFLVFYRFVDQPSGNASNNISTTYDLAWGIFFGLLAALFLAYTGQQLRAAHVTEPPLPRAVEVPETAPVPTQPAAPRSAPPARTAAAQPRPRPHARPEVDGGEQLSFDD